jgi:hypothetical protein
LELANLRGILVYKAKVILKKLEALVVQIDHIWEMWNLRTVVINLLFKII